MRCNINVVGAYIILYNIHSRGIAIIHVYIFIISVCPYTYITPTGKYIILGETARGCGKGNAAWAKETEKDYLGTARVCQIRLQKNRIEWIRYYRTYTSRCITKYYITLCILYYGFLFLLYYYLPSTAAVIIISFSYTVHMQFYTIIVRAR